jgi:hypothetical protein
MPHEWLRPLSVDQFGESHLGRGPYARPGAAASALAQLTWDVLGSILDSRSGQRLSSNRPSRGEEGAAEVRDLEANEPASRAGGTGARGRPLRRAERRRRHDRCLYAKSELNS